MLSDWEYVLKDKYQNKINNKNTKPFIDDIFLLSKNYPRDYIIGYVNFLNCKIDLSKKPLIPRVETEYWIEKVLPIIKTHFKDYKNTKVLDIFSGSGCIGVSVAKTIKNTNIDFSDIEKKNLDQIKINLKLNNVKNYQKILKSDIFSKINRKYDLILANPPYVPQLDAIKAPFEPSKAIIAGKDGLSIIKPFIGQIKRFLNKNGIFVMEFYPNQAKSIKAMLIKHGFKEFEFYQDQYKRWRFVIVKVT